MTVLLTSFGQNCWAFTKVNKDSSNDVVSESRVSDIVSFL